MDDDGVTIDMLEDCGSPISIRKTGGVAPPYIYLYVLDDTRAS